jgi:hypothetical protein
MRTSWIVMQLPIRRLVLSCILQLRGFPPGSQLVRVCIYRSALVVELPMYRHSLALLPTTDGLLTAIEPGRDFLPGVQGAPQLLANCVPGLRVQRRWFTGGHSLSFDRTQV